MPQIINRPPNTQVVRIKAGAEWRGVKYFEPKMLNLSEGLATYVVETLKIAEFVAVDTDGNYEDS